MYYQEGQIAYKNRVHICPYGDWLDVWEAKEWHEGWNSAYEIDLYNQEMDLAYGYNSKGF